MPMFRDSRFKQSFVFVNMSDYYATMVAWNWLLEKHYEIQFVNLIIC
jgi:hypothetical protein